MPLEDGGLVSVVMAVYNAESYVRDTLLSVLHQSHANLDIIVVDDCSTDRSVEVIQELVNFDKRIRLLHTDGNSGGPACPRNVGISVSLGEYVAFIDADDLWVPDKIEKQLSSMGTNKVMSFTDNKIIDGNGQVLMARMSPAARFFRKMVARHGLKFLLLSNQIVLSSVVVKKSILGELRYDEDNFMHAVEDYGLWLNIAQSHKNELSYLDLPLTLYRKHTMGISANYTMGRVRAIYCIAKFYLGQKKLLHPWWGVAGCVLRMGKSTIGIVATRLAGFLAGGMRQR